ncbi:MAG: class I SAM-dependent methyltransferase [Chthoniobacterales bacterium]
MKNLLRKLHLIPNQRAEREKRSAEKARRNLTVPNARRSYADYLASLLAKKHPETAMSLAVGGDYEVMGEALRQRLVRFGLQPDNYLIDVGCGSGRLAFACARSDFRDTLRYLGVDIVPEMLAFAAEKCRQPRWRFELVTDPRIPENDEVADMVCFFSVFTHLMEEESFLYLREARRVLRPGGRIVASYLDIAMPAHWEIFEANVQSARWRQEKPMDIFLSAAFFETWAARLELDLIEDRAPDCGQRTCVLQKSRA